VQVRALEAASGARDPHFMQVIQEHGAVPELVQRALDRPTLEELFERLVAREGVTVESLYTGPAPTPLFLLAEGLLEYDSGFARWRFLHVQLVERIIGPLTAGSGGTLGARYLARTVSQRFLPRLWAVRAEFFNPARPSGAAASASSGDASQR
jgi:tryptophan 2,3-dioxygenase